MPAIRENAEVVTRLMTPDAAVQIGAMALFGEKYGDEVRVVSMGHDPAAAEKFGVYSLELCGGTHVRRTGDIGLFKIVSEGAVAAGVRRVEAVTGPAALKLVEAAEAKLKEAAAVLRVPAADLPARIATLMEERRKLERDVAELRKQLATGGGAAAAETIGGFRVALRNLGDTPARDLKGIAEAILKGGTADIVALVSTSEGKASIVAGLGEAAKGNADAVASCARRRRPWAARVAVGGRKWRRPVVRMATRRTRRWPRCGRCWRGDGTLRPTPPPQGGGGTRHSIAAVRRSIIPAADNPRPWSNCLASCWRC